MNLRIAWRNVWRNPRRSILTIGAIAFACLLLIFMVSFQLGTYETMIESSVLMRTGHLQIFTRDWHDDHEMRQVIPDPSTMDGLLAGIPGVRAYSFRANAFALLSSDDRTYGGMVTGIDPLAEAGVSTLPDLVHQGEYLAADDATQALVGRLLARNLGIGLGDELVVLGQGRDGSIAATVLSVKGIIDSGVDELDRGAVFMSMAGFQETFAMNGAVHETVILCPSLSDVRGVRQAIQRELAPLNADRNDPFEVMDWNQLMPGLMQSIEMDLTSGVIFYIILIIVVTFSIMNTFVMAVFERTREFGVMLALGTRRFRLTRVLLLESSLLTGVGMVLGMIAGVLVTLYFQKHGISMGEAAGEMMRQYGLPERMHPRLTLLSFAVGPVLVFIITMIGALFPALKAARLKPVDAMRAV